MSRLWDCAWIAVLSRGAERGNVDGFATFERSIFNRNDRGKERAGQPGVDWFGIDADGVSLFQMECCSVMREGRGERERYICHQAEHVGDMVSRTDPRPTQFLPHWLILIDPSESVFVYSPVNRALVRPHQHARPRTSYPHLRQFSTSPSLNPTTRALKEISSLSRHRPPSSTIPPIRISSPAPFCPFYNPLRLIVGLLLPSFYCPPSPPRSPPQPSLITPSPFSIGI